MKLRWLCILLLGLGVVFLLDSCSSSPTTGGWNGDSDGDVPLAEIVEEDRVPDRILDDTQDVAPESQTETEAENSVWCGDGICQMATGENCSNCAEDCGCTNCGETCENGACRFTACDHAECGSDGCGGTCGQCDGHGQCTEAGQCAYVPRCGDGACDADEDCRICPADCGDCCGNGLCEPEYEEDCANCSADCGCTGCGETCESAVCTFTACVDMECGDDGCSGSCGSCGLGHICQNGQCTMVSVTPGFVAIPAGAFWMGTPGGCPGPLGYPGSCAPELGHSSETLHYVQLTRPFEMQAHEVTQGQWKAVFGGWNPSGFWSCGDNCPVDGVSWPEVGAYACRLSEDADLPPCYSFSEVICEDGTHAGSSYANCLNDTQGGIRTAKVTVTSPDGNPYNCPGYRFPTEGEWEYAARAGSTTAFYPSSGNDGSITQTGTSPLDPNLDKIGWYGGNSYAEHSVSFDCSSWYTGATICGPQPVGGKAPNAWGLYDMSGNVMEWVWDSYLSSYPSGTMVSPNVDPLGADSSGERVIRGGSWGDVSQHCRVGRHTYTPGIRGYSLGARLARTLVP
jgi:formylglycine-generating enzyme required for sulfatase activity